MIHKGVDPVITIMNKSGEIVNVVTSLGEINIVCGNRSGLYILPDRPGSVVPPQSGTFRDGQDAEHAIMVSEAIARRGGVYTCPYEIKYHSKRYNKYLTVPEGYISDGATGAIDIWSEGFWVHDLACDRGTFDDGTKMNNWQASTILSDILKHEGRWFRARSWFVATWLFGGGKARENGMK